MSPNAEYEVFKLCSGMTLAAVEYRLNILNKYIAAKSTNLRIKLAK